MITTAAFLGTFSLGAFSCPESIRVAPGLFPGDQGLFSPTGAARQHPVRRSVAQGQHRYSGAERQRGDNKPRAGLLLLRFVHI